MWKLGNLEIKGKVVLAPMAGVTFSSYRKFMSNFGVSCFYTEMVSDMGLIYGNEETSRYMDFDETCFPTGVQLFGHDPENIAKSVLIAQKANKNIAFFDVNMGCPVPKVTKPGSGSTLLKTPKLCGDIIRAIKEVTDKPVTAKIRLGWDNSSINFIEVIEELEKAGVDAIAIHARTKKDLYTGLPKYEMLKGLKEKMRVPLIVSGNIFSLDDAIKAVEITNADAVMVARGGIGNPFLCQQIDHYFRTGEKLLNASINEQINYCLQLAKLIIDEFGEDRGIRIYRSMAPKFFNGIPNAKQYKARLACEITTLDSLVNILEEIRKEIDL